MVLGDSPLLVLDYPGRRPEAAVSALRLDDAGFQPLALLTPPLPVEVSGRAYARRLLATTTSVPTAIVAYCAASAIAIHLAHLVHERGDPAPALVLFDAGPTTSADVAKAYVAAIRQVPGGSTPSGELPELSEQPALLVREAHDDLSRRAATALRAQGLSEDVIAEPVAHFARQHVAYLAHLLAARGPVPRDPVGPVLQVLSQHHPDHRDWLPDGELDTVRVDSDRAGLLADESTRTAVLSFLERAADRTPTKRRQRT